MTVGELIAQLSDQIKTGALTPEDEVYLTTSMLPFDESEIFKTGCSYGTDVEYNPKKPARSAVFINAHSRVPNNFINRSPATKKAYAQYGSGYDVIEVEGSIKEAELERKIAFDKFNHLKQQFKDEADGKSDRPITALHG